MIDYDKLREAHELADKYSKTYKQMVRVAYDQYSYEEYKPKFMLYICDWHEENYESIDDLITKLKELTQSEPAESGYISEILEEVIPSNGSISVHAGEYRIIDGRWYAVKEKLNKSKELTQPEPNQSQELPEFIIDGLKPIIESQRKICDLIAELMPQYYKSKEELTQPDPKYKPGQTLWYRDEEYNLPMSFKMLGWKSEEDGIYIDGCKESELYPTKSQLIEAQIEYWKSLREPSEGGVKVFECQHESDGKYYDIYLGMCSFNNQLPYHDFFRCKCIKCGEFYR